jgi:hypothetical protein
MTAAAGVFTFAIWIPAHSFGVLIFFALIGGKISLGGGGLKAKC